MGPLFSSLTALGRLFTTHAPFQPRSEWVHGQRQFLLNYAWNNYCSSKWVYMLPRELRWFKSVSNPLQRPCKLVKLCETYVMPFISNFRRYSFQI